MPGATLFLQAVGDLGGGGRSSNAQYQYTLQGSTFEELDEWTPKIVAALQTVPNLADVSSDQQDKGLQANVTIDRDTASRLGITVSQIDNTLYDAFGQRQVSTIYVARNQYHVIMEVAPEYWQDPQTLKDVYVSTSGGPASGSQTTNAVAGTIASSAQRRVGQFDRSQRCAQSRDQLDRRHRQNSIIDRHGGQHQPGDDDSAVKRRPLRAGPDIAGRQPSGAWSPTRSRSICRPASRLARRLRRSKRP